MYRKYKSATGVEYNFYVSVDGKERLVSFNGPGATLMVSDPDVIQEIETSKTFKDKKIVLTGVVGVPEETEEEKAYDEYPDVRNMNDAIYVLTSGYGVDESQVARKAQVLAKAEELGVRFPNYK